MPSSMESDGGSLMRMLAGDAERVSTPFLSPLSPVSFSSLLHCLIPHPPLCIVLHRPSSPSPFRRYTDSIGIHSTFIIRCSPFSVSYPSHSPIEHVPYPHLFHLFLSLSLLRSSISIHQLTHPHTYPYHSELLSVIASSKLS